eukprot:2820316-Rhodomonas_salina.3
MGSNQLQQQSSTPVQPQEGGGILVFDIACERWLVHDLTARDSRLEGVLHHVAGDGLVVLWVGAADHNIPRRSVLDSVQERLLLPNVLWHPVRTPDEGLEGRSAGAHCSPERKTVSWVEVQCKRQA